MPSPPPAPPPFAMTPTYSTHTINNYEISKKGKNLTSI